MIIGDLASGWQSLREIITFLQSASDRPELAASLTLPQLQFTPTQLISSPQQMNAGFFLFMAALKNGDFRNWLGEKQARALEQAGHGALLQKAEGEFVLMGRLFTDTGQQGWQNMFLPVLVNGELQMVRFYSKRERKKDAHDRDMREGNTRFVVEVTLSELGEMQLDGFYRKQPQERYFELIIRAHQPLTQALQHDIIGIYQNITEAAGLRGSLSFQWLREFPIHPLEHVIEQLPDVVV